MKKLILAFMSIAFAVSGSLTINANTDDNYVSSSDLNLQLDYHGYESAGVFYSALDINNTLAVSRYNSWETAQGNYNDPSRGWYRDGSVLRLDYHEQIGQGMVNLLPIGRYEMTTHASARYDKISIFGILIDLDADAYITFDVTYPSPDTINIEWQMTMTQIPYSTNTDVTISGIDDQGAEIILYDNNVAGTTSLDEAYASGQTAGYNDGYADGDTNGYLRGYNAGFSNGNTQAVGLDQLTTNFSNGLIDILGLEIAGISLGALALIPISISMFLWFMKISRK